MLGTEDCFFHSPRLPSATWEAETRRARFRAWVDARLAAGPPAGAEDVELAPAPAQLMEVDEAPQSALALDHAAVDAAALLSAAAAQAAEQE